MNNLKRLVVHLRPVLEISRSVQHFADFRSRIPMIVRCNGRQIERVSRVRTLMHDSGQEKPSLQDKESDVVGVEIRCVRPPTEQSASSPGGYEYFRTLSKRASSLKDATKSLSKRVKAKDLAGCGKEEETLATDMIEIEKEKDDSYSTGTLDNELQLNINKIQGPIKPALPKKSFNLAAFVRDSETLSNLVKLGVDLSKVEQDIDAANLLTKLDFAKDVEPYLAFLHRNGVSDEDIGECITRNPKIFQVSLNDLEVRVNYFKSKEFTVESIGRILSKMPQLLSTTTIKTDKQLGFLQREFALTGDEVRLVVTRHPKIAIWDSASILTMKMTYKDFLGFSADELKQLLLSDPKLYLAGKHAVMKRFEYIQNKVGFSHQEILVWPSVLRTRLSIIKPRHLFLKHLGRDQFDPKKENFVSLKGLAVGRDVEFCRNFAKVPVKQFNEFLKTL